MMVYSRGRRDISVATDLTDEHLRTCVSESIERNSRPIGSKREEANEKINERDMVGQTCQNPFFNNTKYINVIDVQENFLMPRSSNDKDNCSKNM